MDNIQILVVDFGSQYTLVIGRTVQELGYRSAILPPQKVKSWLNNNTPKAIILSGSDFSVNNPDAPQLPDGILDYGIPVLGICYGMQLMVKTLGGIVSNEGGAREFGQIEVNFSQSGILTYKRGRRVWASHSDSVKKLPEGFKRTAKSLFGLAAMENSNRRLFGLQFHPEVTHTEDGKSIFKKFLQKVCGCSQDWNPEDIISTIRNEAIDKLGGKKAIIGFSGGVDSTTLSAILSPALGKNIFAVCIDTGALRQDELKEIRTHAKAAGIRLRVIHAARRFQAAMSGLIDAARKRKAFKRLYTVILKEAAKEFGAKFIVQGTLATDLIESGAAGQSAQIKAHHNVNNDWRPLSEIHPLRHLFKYEVRELAKILGLPKSVSERQPFPGPGLFIRVIGTPATLSKLAIVRWADATVTRNLKCYKMSDYILANTIYEELSQLIVALNGVKTVGIKGDARSYAFPIVIRGVKTKDFMTVSGFQISPDVRKRIEKELTQHPHINRVWWDETDKPPATTEME